jgi:putative protease
VYYLAQIGRAYRKALDTMLLEQAFDTEVLNDVYATASRDFTPGFLINVPEESRQNYERGYSMYSACKFGGIVRHYDPKKGLAEVEIKNRIAVGNIVECVTPHQVFSQKIRTMYDLSFAPLVTAHGGGPAVLIKIDRAIEPFTLLRLPIKQKEENASCK